jgi:hypothetical protein
VSDRVYLEHPDLPGQGIRVRERAVPTYREAGWQPATEPRPEPAADPNEDARPRRRRETRPAEGDEH